MKKTVAMDLLSGTDAAHTLVQFADAVAALKECLEDIDDEGARTETDEECDTSSPF